MSQILVTIKDAAWAHDGLWRIDEINLELDPQSVVALVGASGIGKSTLLKAIAGWHRKLKVSTRRIVRRSDDSEIQDDDVVYMPQHTEDIVLPWYDVKKNLRIASGRSRQTAMAPQDIADYARRLGLGKEHLSKKPRDLSGGMERRLAFGMVLLRQPIVLLLDEPFTGLDVDLRLRMWNELHVYLTRTNRKAAALMITHSAEEAMSLATKIVEVKMPAGESLSYVEHLVRPKELKERDPGYLFNPPENDTLAIEWERRVRKVFASIGDHGDE